MQFSKTKTSVNLARAFAGECQAGMRYQLIAKLATKEEYPVLADTVRTVAKNETYHAKSFYDTLILKNGNSDNIQLDAGYPFRFGTLEETLRFAAEDERAEFEQVYPAFAEEAREHIGDVALVVGYQQALSHLHSPPCAFSPRAGRVRRRCGGI